MGSNILMVLWTINILCLRHSEPKPQFKQEIRAGDHLMWKRLVMVALLIILSTLSVFAQRKPSEATRPVVVMSGQSLDDLNRKLQPGNKTEELIDSAGMQLRVAVQHETNKTGAAAEL